MLLNYERKVGIKMLCDDDANQAIPDDVDVRSRHALSPNIPM